LIVAESSFGLSENRKTDSRYGSAHFDALSHQLKADRKLVGLLD
jgi:hypothetical protein